MPQQISLIIRAKTICHVRSSLKVFTGFDGYKSFKQFINSTVHDNMGLEMYKLYAFQVAFFLDHVLSKKSTDEYALPMHKKELKPPRSTGALIAADCHPRWRGALIFGPYPCDFC